MSEKTKEYTDYQVPPEGCSMREIQCVMKVAPPPMDKPIPGMEGIHIQCALCGAYHGPITNEEIRRVRDFQQMEMLQQAGLGQLPPGMRPMVVPMPHGYEGPNVLVREKHQASDRDLELSLYISMRELL